MFLYYKDWIEILVYLLFIFLLNCIFILLIWVVIYDKRDDKEKISSYECGFDPYEDARGKFEVRFFLIAILFIIFDIEIILIFFLPVIIYKVFVLVLYIFNLFFILLLIGFIYEWILGGMDW